jgi:hypothetical protein
MAERDHIKKRPSMRGGLRAAAKTHRQTFLCQRRLSMTASKKEPRAGAQGQAGVPDAIARTAAPDSAEDKDPNGEYETPSPLEHPHSTPKPAHHDLQGHQGGQKGGSREPQ